MVCHVGVTGHRDSDPTAMPGLLPALTEILETVAQGVTARFAAASPGLYGGARPILRCISPLADGADRIVAARALELGYELQSPLPFLCAEYEKDFREDDAKREFHRLVAAASAVLELDGARSDADEAYLTAGLVVLEQSDVLIAVWDRTRPIKRGGTGHIATEALGRGIPVFVIDPAAPTRFRLLTRDSGDDWRRDLDTVLDRLLKPCLPQPAGKPSLWHWKGLTDFVFGGAPQGTSPQSYFAETRTGSRFPGGMLEKFPTWFEKTLALRWPAPHAADRAAQSGPGRPPADGNKAAVDDPDAAACAWCDSLGLTDPCPRHIEQTLYEHYNWADRLAIHYAARFRTLGLMRHLLMAVVLVGLLIGFYSDHFDILGLGLQRITTIGFAFDQIKAFGFLLQFLGFFGILMLVRRSRHRGWHQRFLDYRYIAEQLRHARYLMFLGRTPPFAHDGADAACTSEAWPAWHLRNVVRQAGLFPMLLCPQALQDYCKALTVRVINDQRDFYTDRHQRYDTISRRLEGLGMFFYIAGLLFILLRVPVFFWSSDPIQINLWSGSGTVINRNNLRILLNMVALAIPTVVSIIFALRSQGEYARLALRYGRMLQMIDQKDRELQHLTPLTSANLANFAEALDGLLASEVTGWHVLVKGKGLSPY